MTLLTVRGIQKRFGDVVANDGIDLDLPAGQLHGLVGENGAGKSTLIKIISGLQKADAGTVLVEGVALPTGSPRAALDAGIGMVHQEPLVLRRMTVLENLVAGARDGVRHSRGRMRVDAEAGRALLKQHGEAHGFHLDPEARVETLTIGEHQQLEIVRLLAAGVRVLILDEPTSAISADQRDLLYGALGELATEGISVILVSHKLEEVIGLCQDVTVLRHGAVTGRRSAPLDAGDLVNLMFDTTPPVIERVASTASDDVVLDVADLVAHEGTLTTSPLALSVRAGEVVGLAGLEGSGQRALLRAVAGLDEIRSGTIELAGQGPAGAAVDSVDLVGRGAHERAGLGVHYVPADRASDGLVPGLSVTDHVLLRGVGSSDLDRPGRFIHRERAAKAAGSLITSSRVVGTATSTPEELSGGNQQRLMLGLLPDEIRLLLLEHPTRGLDLQSAAWVWEGLRSRSAAGTAVVFASADLDELLRADRIVVFFSGEILAEVDPASTTVEQLGHLIGGSLGMGSSTEAAGSGGGA